MDKSRIVIVIPAFNESATIKGIVESVSTFGIAIVVDDGSTDNTAKLAMQAGAVVVTHDNRGYDAALNSGFRKAAELEALIIITLDADGQHNPSAIRQFVDAIDSGADVVVGTRSRQQRFAEYLFSVYTSFRFGVKDPLCGMKAYRIGIYEALGHFDSYKSIGTELLVYAAMKGYRIGQVDLDLRKRHDHPRFGSLFLANYKIVRSLILSFWYIK
jgi:glycosyltransferase involved in cell wall biosynthesis